MFWNNKKYDLIAIGDTVTDAFIRLEDAHLSCNIDNTACEICMKFGDKIPYEFVEVCPAVGNSANAAVSTARLGISTAMLTNIGDDLDGKEAIKEFERNNVGTNLISIQKGKKTNYHYVLWFESDRTILIKHETFGYSLPNIVEPKWIYLSSLGENTLPFHKEIEKYLETHPDVKLAFQPGTYQMKFGTDALAGIYKNTEIFVCNLEESQRILKTEEKDLKTLLNKLHQLGPKIVVITDGPKGAYASDGTNAYFHPPYPDPKPPYERTGAGDAFASTLTAAIMLGKTLEEALSWAPINSMSVVQQIGAQKGLLSQEKLLEYLKNAPEDYKPRKI
jgi:sugar/nucleoside kinase (ribokinase family)